MSRKRCCCTGGCLDPNCETGNCDTVLADCGTLGPLGFSVELELTCRPATCSRYDAGGGEKCPNQTPPMGFGALSGCPRGGPGWEATPYADCPPQEVLSPTDGGMSPTWVCTPANPLTNNKQELFQWASHWTGNSYLCPTGYAENSCIAVSEVKDHGNVALTYGQIAVVKTISSTVGWVNCPPPDTAPPSAINFNTLREVRGVFGKACGVCGPGANVCCDPSIIETPCACECLGGGQTTYQLLSATNDPHDGVVYGRIAWFAPCAGPSTVARNGLWCGQGCTGDATHRSSMFCLEILATFAVSSPPEKVPYAVCPDINNVYQDANGVYSILLNQGTLLGAEADGRVWRYEQRHVWVVFKHCNDQYTGEGNKCRMQSGDYIPIRTGICLSDIYFPKGCCNYPVDPCDNPPCNPAETECACSDSILYLMKRAGWDFTKIRIP